MKHINAKNIFPAELVKEIQKYYSGSYLWIPKSDKKAKNESVTRKPKRQ